MDAFEREREHSISQSYEGSDIVYENLLGDLSKRSITNSSKSTIDIASDIEDIFDDDIFDLNKEEIEKRSNYLLTDAEEDLEEESVEGADPTTSPSKPANIDVFDSILLDLDEKTKEMEKNQKKKKKKKKKKRKRRHKKSEQDVDESKECLDNLQRFKQCDDDKKMLEIAISDGCQLNPWILRKWEFNEHHKRRSLRTLLSTLNEDILWKRILNEENGWMLIKRKDIIYDEDCYRVYLDALSIFHCDNSLRRGDSIQEQIVCAWIYNALQNAYNVMKNKQ